MDDLRWEYYKEVGYDEGLAKQKWDREGPWGLYSYSKRFEAYAVERLLSEYKNCVIDFGAGHSVYENDGLFERVQHVLAAYKNIVLLLPSADFEECVQILKARQETLGNELIRGFRVYRQMRRYAGHWYRRWRRGRISSESCKQFNRKPDLNEHLIKHRSNHELAKFVVYTKGKTPEETCDEILLRLGIKCGKWGAG